MIGTSAGRVPANTSQDTNVALKLNRSLNVDYYSDHPHEIPQRLKELDREWDIERALAAMSSAISLFGLGLGFSGRKRAFLLPAIIQGFYLQHTIQGWCPPLPVLRGMGYRTEAEIEKERSALKGALRQYNADQTACGEASPDEYAVVVEEFSLIR